jgi:hypothetical protein
MAQQKTELSYGVIIVGIALTAWGVSNLLQINSLLAQWIAGVLVALTAMTCVAGIIHYWRFGQYK